VLTDEEVEVAEVLSFVDDDWLAEPK
jgi:hypothetical protein